jgi:hypothetical protein
VSLVVPHTLSVADTIAFGVVRACRQRKGQVHFIDAPDILREMGTPQVQAASKPFTWPVEVFYQDSTIKCSLTPDRLFATSFPAAGIAWFFALEEDRTSEPNQRNDFSFNAGTSIFRKLLCYVFAYHARVPDLRYGIKGFRILFVTDSHDRIEHVLAVWKRANEALKAFQKRSGIDVRAVPNNVLHCIDRATLREHDMFTVPWTNGNGDRVMLDLPASVAP